MTDSGRPGMGTFAGLGHLRAAVGHELGTSDWHTVEQERVDGFAEVTGDHQWIHVDPERAAQGPFGTTVAHGYLTLSLLPMLAREAYQVQGVRMAVNYGLDRVRFPAPVPVGAEVRASFTLLDCTPIDGGLQCVIRATVAVRDAAKPSCVAETVVRLYG